MHTHPPIDPDDPSGASGEDVREPPLPGTQGTPREEFRAKATSWIPSPLPTTNRQLTKRGRSPRSLGY